MPVVPIKKLAEQIGIPPEKLLQQLSVAGVSGKDADGILDDDERSTLLAYLRGGKAATSAPKPQEKVTLNRRTTTAVKQSSRTGGSRTVHVEVKKRRTYVRRGELQRQQEEAEQAAREAEEAREREAQAQVEAEEKAKQEAAVAAEAEAQAQREAEAAAKAAEQTTQIETPVPTTPVPPEDGKGAGRREDKPKKRKGKGRSDSGGELHLAEGKRGRRRPRQPIKPRRLTSTTAGQHAFEKPTEPVSREISVPETISVADLAQSMSVKAAEVIRVLMEMGSMVTINQVLDQDTAILVVEEMGHKALAADLDDPEAMLSADEGADDRPAVARAPVVTVMGHVDHGKTSLLDYLRKTKVTAGEAGGITQHIGAYRVATEKGTITFLDTPGHEAFSAMRSRGAQVTDLVVLVVAADDGVKPQTIEAISHARQASVPLIVAINKMDKEDADPDRVKQELATQEVIPEDWGGDTLMNEVSAMTGEGIDTLLDSVLLQSEMLDLTAPDQGLASGTVVEARLDRGKGVVATLLVQKGSLGKGDIVIAGREFGRARAMTSDSGEVAKVAGPSTPVEIQGLGGVPDSGDEFSVVTDERRAREVTSYRQAKFKEVKLARQQKAKLESMFSEMGEGQAKTLNVIIKGDVQGSVEALTESLEKLSTDKVRVLVVHGMVGGINESDVNLAGASEAIVIAFNVRADATARKLIETEGIDVRYHSVIYDVVDEVTTALTGMLAPVIREQAVGLAEVRDVFRVAKMGAVAGCRVIEGEVRRHLPVRVLRDNVVIFDGHIDSLKRFKDDVSEVKSGFECGIGVKNYNDIKPGDQIEIYETIEQAATL
ncbi:MAG: translation initiation factor IF-2 [Acidiferrobacteraceae bacterium]|jgi:translation initiation factor IF-2|nr:translation initiation factor IF-2 [Acidiferrobacteraceae bacterium]MDP6552437.1 translation initiation factor IF-2 [Arenicellales bacterium]MDP6790275.1 translation initiation factor IF-2 [Arenicellales bacterium]MDP6918251.1 translation initiation factor IF-2 [Arenicellales bacterium]|tara:strand:+ start:25813 stop:28299 length:2487 start_codon:yes stop_codon:yes gene_type:complete